MTAPYEDQIKRALKLLKPADDDAAREILKKAIEELATVQKENRHLADLYAKPSRTALKAFRVSIRRADATYKRLPAGMKLTVNRLHELRGRPPLAFDALGETIDEILGQPKTRSRIDYVKLNAAALAWNIFGLLELGRPPLSKGGKWPKLAAILSGSKDDFFHHCQIYYAGLSSGQK